MVITTDGDVAPCCYDKIPSFLLGNVNNKSINTIWKSKETNSFRRSVINKDRSINICDNCNG